MLSKLVKDHQTKQAKLKEENGKSIFRKWNIKYDLRSIRSLATKYLNYFDKFLFIESSHLFPANIIILLIV